MTTKGLKMFPMAVKYIDQNIPRFSIARPSKNLPQLRFLV
jgi:hypothetical protein